MIAGAIVTAIATDNVAAVSFLFILLTSQNIRSNKGYIHERSITIYKKNLDK